MNIPNNGIDALLCGAREGGTTHWAQTALYKEKQISVGKRANGIWWGGEWKNGAKPLNWPENELPWFNEEYNAFQSFIDNETGKEHFITHENIENGLKIMMEKYNADYQDILNENDDANTSDIFIQCCIFGEVIYS